MNHRPSTKSAALLPELAAELARVRARRGFQPHIWLDAKTKLLADYLREHKLTGTVVGLSGGIDSAVVLGILLETQTRYPEVLTKVVPLVLPTHTAEVGQMDAADRAIRLCKHWEMGCSMSNLQPAHVNLCFQIETALGIMANSWARGQLTSYLRTPALYFATSVLTADGCPSVVVGTTNRDEGAYLGYVGKASDGMVDIQLIADLHKSEVHQMAEYLGVTEEIRQAVPSGEMFDGRVDEEVFGAPYAFVELYLSHLCDPTWPRAECLNDWSDAAAEQYSGWMNALEALHSYNAHKYLVGSPAVHLNVLESAVPGGWTK